ncbi:replicative DNA helicase [Heliorestis convoluta]|uniref:Replicative DNA helicase n=1 Tax=Heliorestis convoluta TaxID=356322 RepID=A0A5Q2N4Z0_9FIRM|nr:replicative DNA helicase [Heliorestis convoluta]QGG48959.1 replicative DNA helicase [Heliorestis convoluta]
MSNEIMGAEQSFLGCFFLDNDIAEEAFGWVDASDFSSEAHRQIYQVFKTLNEAGQPIDYITASRELQGKVAIDYIIQLADTVPSVANIKQYAQMIRKESQKRKIIALTTKAHRDLIEKDAEEVLPQLEKSLQELAVATETEKNYKSIAETLPNVWGNIQERKKIKGLPGHSTGYQHLDNMTDGLQKGELVILAARPSMGKTALALKIALNVAKKGVPTGVFSLEMTTEQLVQRLLACECLVDLKDLKHGKMTQQDEEAVKIGMGEIAKYPLYTDDDFGDLDKLIARAKKMKRDFNLGFLAVDYLQIVSTGSAKNDNRNLEITKISWAFKKIAKELNIPVLLLSQLSRTVEQQQNKRPNLSHLRDSGAIEQDADQVWFIYRDEYYNQESEKKGIAEIIVAKNRNGSIGTVELGFLKEYVLFATRDDDGMEKKHPLGTELIYTGQGKQQQIIS